MKLACHTRLLENILVYLGLVLLLASLIFYGGIELLIYYRQSMVSVSMQPILQMCQETAVLFLFAIGAACALYSVMAAWQRIGPPTTYPDDKES
ncbi:hypothetical protein [Providencia rustigianii]|uniref:hypothetical protein n=1 Tax=Providencia rustigianii TaxID=158850 RepID=UPI0038B39798